MYAFCIDLEHILMDFTYLNLCYFTYRLGIAMYYTL